MAAREYRLGRRQSAIERTRAGILAAAGELVAELGTGSSVGKVAERAGVSRITVYNQFGSKAGLLAALVAEASPPDSGLPADEPGTDPAGALRLRIEQACAAWARDPRLFRQLPAERQGERSAHDHALAERLAASDRLRPGCSIKEAEDVIGILTSFPVFDRLHQGGRRSASGVAEILLRMSAGFTSAQV